LHQHQENQDDTINHHRDREQNDQKQHIKLNS
jgi:hypothetical protein